MSVPEEQQKISWIKSPAGVTEIYANMMHATWTFDDVRLRLGQIVDSPETPNPGPGFKGASEERAAVTFTWRNAKMLRNQLNSIIEYYEKVNGEIKIDLVLPSSSEGDK
jgi:hypothetical protein